MPEYREILGSVCNLQRWYREMKASASPLTLRAVWVDATEAEQKTALAGSRASQGHVFILPPDQECPRGSCGSQKEVYPPPPWSNVAKGAS